MSKKKTKITDESVSVKDSIVTESVKKADVSNLSDEQLIDTASIESKDTNKACDSDSDTNAVKDRKHTKLKWICGILLFSIVMFIISMFFDYCRGTLYNVTINNKRLGKIDYHNAQSYVEFVLSDEDKVFLDSDVDYACVTYSFKDSSSLQNASFQDYIESILVGKVYCFNYIKTINTDNVMQWVDTYNTLVENTKNAYVVTDNYYNVASEQQGISLDKSKVLEVINNYNNETQIDIYAYTMSPTITKDDIMELCSEANKYIDWSCTYSNGNIIKATISDVSISLDNGVTLNDSFIDNVVESAVASYNTKKGRYDFVTVDGRKMKIENETLSTGVDLIAESEYLKSQFKDCASIVDRNPALTQSFDTIGDTYVEVSIAKQHLWYVENGSVVFESDIVTGENTPDGCFYIYNILENSYLFDNDICLTVNANREAFGNTVYIKDGTNGNIELPTDNAELLSSYVKKGTVLVIY